MVLDINLTDIIKSAITAAINAIAVLLSVRYVSRVMDKVEKNGKSKRH